MATRQTSKQVRPKAAAKVDTKIINKPVRYGGREAERRILRARPPSAEVRIDQLGPTAAAADGTVAHNKPRQAPSGSQPTAGRPDLEAASMSGADQPPAGTKRAKLIAMLERPEGASVAEIGQLLGWLPHTVRAAITGLRQTGRAVTRSKDADDRSVYRLGLIDPCQR
jgi:hypothetical protein